MKSRMNKLMSLCLVALMGSTLIPQPIQAEEVGTFEEESFEEKTVEFEEATFEEESNQVAESSVELNGEKTYIEEFYYKDLKYGVTDSNAKTVEVIGFATDHNPAESEYELNVPEIVTKQNQPENEYTVTSIGNSAFKKIKQINLN